MSWWEGDDYFVCHVEGCVTTAWEKDNPRPAVDGEPRVVEVPGLGRVHVVLCKEHLAARREWEKANRKRGLEGLL